MPVKQNNANCKVKLCCKNKMKIPSKGYITIFTNCKPVKVLEPPKKCRKSHKPKKCRCGSKPAVCTIKQPIQVTAKQLDIRNLVRDRDHVKAEMFGTDGTHLRAVRTDEAGRLEVAPAPEINTVFNEEKFLNWDVTHEMSSTPPQNTAVKTMTSYAVINRGDHPALVRIEISPNGSDFVLDQKEVVKAKAMKVFVPNFFLKWTRISAQTEGKKNGTVLDVYFQSQTTGSK